MKETSYEELLEQLNRIDTKDRLDNEEIIEDDQIEQLSINNIEYNKRSILGYDIYEYSQYELSKQSLIPFVFDLLYKETKTFCLRYARALFDVNDFDNNLISTGDGGFIIFQNPLQCVVFNTLFLGLLQTFNSCSFYPKLRDFIGPLTIRSCITTDKVYHYENNYFGPAIITNSRIISRDKLNRFLIDENTYQWFLKNLNGIENIPEITYEDICNANLVKKNATSSIFFYEEVKQLKRLQDRRFSKYKNCHIQKIGTVTAKKNVMSVYNVEIQAYMYYVEEKNQSIGRCFTVTIGNLNCTGIGEI